MFGPTCSGTELHDRLTVAIPAFLADLLAGHLAGRVPEDPDAFIFTALRGGPLRRTEFAGWSWRRR